jgi:hypothetical protein
VLVGRVAGPESAFAVEWEVSMHQASQSREARGKSGVFWSGRARLLILGLAVSAVSGIVVTPSLTTPLTVWLQYTPALGPLLIVSDVAVQNQMAGKAAFALVSFLILLPMIRFRLATVIASVCGLLAWGLLGIIGAGIQC